MILDRKTSLGLVCAIVLGACGGSPGGSSSTGPGGSAASPVTGTAAATSAATPTAAGGVPAGIEADPCTLVTKAQAETLAGGTVTVETGALPGPPGQGAFCKYTARSSDELEIRTAADRGDFDNDRKLAIGNDWHETDVPGIGDEAWTEKGPFFGSINVIAKGQWVRISTSYGFGSKPFDAIPGLVRLAIQRLL